MDLYAGTLKIMFKDENFQGRFHEILRNTFETKCILKIIFVSMVVTYTMNEGKIKTI